MIKYIITGLPRSGTTWLSVFLSTDDCLCLHDPLADYSLEELEKWEGGISDTSLWLFEEWCNKNATTLIVIDRKVSEVNESLVQLDLSPLSIEITSRFADLKCVNKVYFEDLFTEEIAEELWNKVHPDKPFNLFRWSQLSRVNIEPTTQEVERLKKVVKEKECHISL